VAEGDAGDMKAERVVAKCQRHNPAAHLTKGGNHEDQDRLAPGEAAVRRARGHVGNDRVRVSRKASAISTKVSIIPMVGTAICEAKDRLATAGRSNGSDPCASRSTTG